MEAVSGQIQAASTEVIEKVMKIEISQKNTVKKIIREDGDDGDEGLHHKR